ncbi:protein of unknown function [Nitrospira japonica]|uniref:Uncharacterized protein n=1 Tax=Nitrospira japonica TaxID=1325564 RepID=A0A1W1I891_9BACT|nr:protein of unknown function [Nitrospira japonica]
MVLFVHVRTGPGAVTDEGTESKGASAEGTGSDKDRGCVYSPSSNRRDRLGPPDIGGGRGS